MSSPLSIKAPTQFSTIVTPSTGAPGGTASTVLRNRPVTKPNWFVPGHGGSRGSRSRNRKNRKTCRNRKNRNRKTQRRN